MAAATVCLMATGCVPAMCAAILITCGYRTFARSVSAFFVRFCVVHFFSIVLVRTAAIQGRRARFAGTCLWLPYTAPRRLPVILIRLVAKASEDYYGEDGESRFERR